MKAIRFYFPEKKIFHTAACLIQGFIAKGYEVFSNVQLSDIDSRGVSTPYSTIKPPTLGEFDDCNKAPVVIDVTQGFGNVEEINRLVSECECIILNMSDSANFQDFIPNLPVLTAHKNGFVDRIGSFYPLPFGLSQDLIELRAGMNPKIAHRANLVINNFSASLAQGVRNFLRLSFEERLEERGFLSEMMIEPDDYITALCSRKFICAYGGDIYRNLNVKNFRGTVPFENPSYQFQRIDSNYLILRWDSWRFYEAALFGCIPIHLDFQKYKMELPVPPPRSCYVPVDLSRLESSLDLIESLIKDDTLYERFSSELTEWVISTCSPKGLANYVEEVFDCCYTTHI